MANMYGEVTHATNLRALSNLQDINTITEQANGLLAKTDDATLRARRIEYFYDKMLLDTIKLGSENNVFLKYCNVKSIPKGNEKLLLRRWGGLTEHTHPLAEGIPPKSDRMASESFTGTFCSYGRYMEFTDRVDFMLIDPVVAHYSMELGDVAVRMAERLCRKELENNAGETYPKGKTFATLAIGDTVGIEDYRLQALKYKRLLVKPLANGKYIVICSPEHIYDLVNDPLVKEYMLYTKTAEPYVTGKPVPLFDIQFEETMLDDYAYGYTEVSNPGEFDYVDGATLKKALRLVIVKEDKTIHYVNVPAISVATTTPSGNVALQSNMDVLASAQGVKRTVAGSYIKDGSYIPGIVSWDIADWKSKIAADTTTTHTIATTTVSDGVLTASTVTVADIKKANIYQLPVHRSFMFGNEFIYKTGIDGEMDAKFFVKPLGSAGTLDPINQRQSVGFKINTLGFNCVRSEAMTQFVFVPTEALTTYISISNSLDSSDMKYNAGTAASVNVVNPTDASSDIQEGYAKFN